MCLKAFSVLISNISRFWSLTTASVSNIKWFSIKYHPMYSIQKSNLLTTDSKSDIKWFLIKYHTVCSVFIKYQASDQWLVLVIKCPWTKVSGSTRPSWERCFTTVLEDTKGFRIVFKTDHFFAGYYIFSTPFANSTKALSLASCRARSDLLQVSLLDNSIFVIVIFLAPDLSDAYNTFEWPAFCFLLCQKCAPKYPSTKP